MNVPDDPDSPDSPFETDAAQPVLTDDELTATIPTPAGPVDLKSKTTLGSPANQAQAVFICVMTACVWMIAAGWTFGYALKVPVWLGAVVALLPALAVLGLGMLATYLHKRPDPRQPSPTYSPPRPP